MNLQSIISKLLSALGIKLSYKRAAPAQVKKKKVRNRRIIIFSHVANLFTAISVVGLGVLGVIGASITLKMLITSAIVIGVIGVIGRWLDSTLDDEEEYELDNN